MADIETASQLAIKRLDGEKNKALELQAEFTLTVTMIVRDFVDAEERRGLAPEVSLARVKKRLWASLGIESQRVALANVEHKLGLTPHGVVVMKQVIDDAVQNVSQERGIECN